MLLIIGEPPSEDGASQTSVILVPSGVTPSALRRFYGTEGGVPATMFANVSETGESPTILTAMTRKE